MAELKGFARFRKTKTAEPKYFDIEVGKITVDSKVRTAIENIKKKFGDPGKFGTNAVKTDSAAVAVMLEQMVYAKKSRRRPKKGEKASSAK